MDFLFITFLFYVQIFKKVMNSTSQQLLLETYVKIPNFPGTEKVKVQLKLKF